MNLLEKYYLQGKGKLMAGIFVLVVLLIISTIAFTGCFSSGKKSDDKNTVTVFNYGDYIDVSVLKTFEKETGIKVTLTMLASGGLELKENCVMTGSTPIAITMFTNDGKVLFNYNEKSFEYFSGMFKEACEFYTLLGGVL